MARLVIAIGGNAISDPSMHKKSSEFIGLQNVASEITNLYKKGNKIVVTHGNGPQVGSELERNEVADRIPELPLYLLTAETQAVIGSSIAKEIRNSGVPNVCAMLTHVLVNENDPGFRNPTKPIGPFMERDGIKLACRRSGLKCRKFEKGFRLVVPSPEPIEIMEINNIDSVSKNSIAIACGGGGIPVASSRNVYHGVNAVVDKDLCSSLLAIEIGADALIILTDAEYVYSDYVNRSGPIRDISARLLGRSLERFEAGTMRPKIKACLDFVNSTGKPAYIGNILKLNEIIKHKSGTKIKASD